jgi:nitrous oxide reductase accessory protein NosL
MIRGAVFVVAVGVALSLAACKSRADRTQAALAASAAPVGGAECAACGMIVRDQPPPHGQVVYHDGTRAFACSIADLVQTLAVPSGHGSPERIFVEALSADVVPAEITPKTPGTWVDATSASYVLGVARPGVMGTPVLVYAARADAERAAGRYNGHVVSWGDLHHRILEAHP